MNDKIIAFGLVLVFLLSGTVGIVSALSNSGGGDWKYYDEITVKENSGKTLTDYQVLVELSAVNFPTQAKSDGSDLRFEDASGKELNYWIEEWDYGAKEAKIWVKVPSISANGEPKIKMYYGNEKASAVSDGDKVFEFFDDFEDRDISDWSEKAGQVSWSVSTDAAKEGTYGLKGHMDSIGGENLIAPYSGENIVITTWIRLPDAGTDNNNQNQVLYGYAEDDNLYRINVLWTTETKAIKLQKRVAASETEKDVAGFTASPSDWYKLDVKVIKTASSLHFLVDLDGSNYLSWTDNDPLTTPNSIGVGAAHSHPGINLYWDTYRVRKYASPEPTVTIIPIPTPTASPTAPVVTPTHTPIFTPTPTPVPTKAPIGKPQLTISQTTLIEEPEVGEDTLITVTISNTGDGIAKNINLREHIPSSVSINYVDGANSAGNLVTWGGDLDVGQTYSIIHSFRILEEKNRAVPVKVTYEDEEGKRYETSATIYISAKAEEIPEPTPIPGFGAVFAIVGLLAVASLLRKRK